MAAQMADEQEHIIYIDDSTVALESVGQSLGAAGYRVTLRTGLRDLGRELESADIVLIDYHMPGMDGSEVLAHLRETCEAIGAAPSFFLYTSDKDRGGDYRELGFDGRMILKGNNDALVKQIRSALRVRSLRKLRDKA